MSQCHTSMTRRGFLATAGTATAMLPLATAGAQRRRPNILFLLTDDQRWDGLGCAGNPIVHTPNLDRLAAEGVRFRNCFVTTSICAPSRASIFTGMYTRTHGVDDFAKPLPGPLLDQTYPLRLRAEGYRTGFVGKWGIGGEMPSDEFDFFEGFPGQGQYFHDIDGERVHLTRILARQSLDFIDGCGPEQPFCLSVSFKSPHVQDGHTPEFLYDPELEHLYQDAAIPLPETATDAHFEQLPFFARESEGRVRWRRRFSNPEQFQESVKGYYRLISGVDRAVGQMLDALEANGLADNTVVVFTSDNGFFLGEKGLAGKWLMYEESIRVPLVVFDPRVPREQRGTVRDEMALNIDMAPTILDLAGAPASRGMQGRSLAPLVRGGAPAWREEWFYEHHFGEQREPIIPASEGIHTGRWKYIQYLYPGPPYEELYDVVTDPRETRNLAGEPAHAERLIELRTRWNVWRNHLRPWQSYSELQPWREPA